MFRLKNIKKGFEQFEIKTRKKLKAHHFLFAFVGGVGVIMFWYGVWDITSKIMPSWCSMIIGMLILIFLGIFIIETVGKEALVEEIEQATKNEKKTVERLEKIEAKLEKTEKRLEKKAK